MFCIVRTAYCRPSAPIRNLTFLARSFTVTSKLMLLGNICILSLCKQRLDLVFERNRWITESIYCNKFQIISVAKLQTLQSWMYLSWTSTAEGHNSGRGSGFQAYILKLMLLNLYMCQQLWFNRVTAQLALNKHSTMLPCLTLLIDMTLGFLACQGDSTNAIWAYLGVSAMLRLTPCLQFVSTGHLEYKIRPLSNRQTFIFYCDFLKTILKKWIVQTVNSNTCLSPSVFVGSFWDSSCFCHWRIMRWVSTYA